MIAMINHLVGHATVNTDVFARDEGRLVGTEVQYHVGYIHGITHPADGLLSGIGAFINGISCVNPTWRNGVDPDTASKTDRQRMGQRRNSAFGGGVALGLRLAHAVTRRGDVHNRSTLGKVRREEFGEVERSSDANAHRILELLIAALVNPLHQWQGIVDEIVHPTIFLDDLAGKTLQYLFVSDITHKVISRLLVNHADVRTCLEELLGNAAPYALCAACYDRYFIFKIHSHYGI